MIRNSLLARTALGLALTFGMSAAAPAFAADKPVATPKVQYSKEFAKAAADLDKTISAAVKNPAVVASSQKVRAAGSNVAARATAVAEIEAALGGNVKARLDTAAAAATTPGDKLKLGELTRLYGTLIDDHGLVLKGASTMLESGALAATNVGAANWVAGVAAYQGGDYAAAAKYVQAAKDAGFRDPQLEGVLVDAYRLSNNMGGALQNAQREIAAAKAAGRAPAESAIRTALQVAYDARQAATANDLSAMLVQYYPAPTSWTSAAIIARQLGNFGPQESLDLSRLMLQNGSLATQRDFVEYIQAADPRRSPGEVLKVVNLGLAQGKLKGVDSFVTEAKTTAQSRVAADKASLAGLERDARAGTASAAIVTAAADAFLSYDDYAKAADLFKLALAKPGVDSARTLTRLGIAQTMLGQYADAQASFGKVTGLRQPIARLWSIYAAQKANPAGTAPVSPAAAPRS